MVPLIDKVQVIETNSEFEALVLEASLIKEKQPKYNTDLKDDKHPIYICVTKETYPRLRLLRKNQLDDSQYESYGPYSSARVSRELLRTLRRVIPFCTSKSDNGRPCFYSTIELCDPCPRYIANLPKGEQTTLKRRYLAQIRMIKDLLGGKPERVRAALKKEMKHAADQEQFELAARYRNAIEQLQRLLQPREHVREYINNPELAHELKLQGIDQLRQLLEQKWEEQLPELDRIEAYDNATLMGEQTTGSMVVLVDGEPAPSEYRRFKISKQHKHSDVHSMEEMLNRRFSIRNQAWDRPELVVVDGGITQVKAAYKALQKQAVDIPVIGLAKRFETLIVPEISVDAWEGGSLPYKSINLPPHSPALQTVQHIRDEAHRFARKYHHYLRSKQVMR